MKIVLESIKPGLSVCMIVKNEEKNIHDAIESFIPFADEIIINDTGSSDKTKNIIESYRSYNQTPTVLMLITSEWKDDFSYSRNLSLNNASHEWIIWLDADDIIPKNMIDNFNKLKTAPLDRCFRFRIKNTIGGGLPLGAQWMQLRMFPNRPDIRFSGAIHEQIGIACENAGLEQFSTDTEIWHTGYDDNQVCIQKTKRNLRIMEKNDYGKNPTERCAVAVAHYRLKNWHEGIKRYTDVFSDSKITPVNHSIAFQLPALIGRGYYRLKQHKTAIEWFRTAHEHNIEAMYEMAQCYEDLKDFNKALECFLKVLTIPEILLLSAQDYHYCRTHAFHRAWVIMIALGRHKEALNVLNKLHEDYPEFRIPK